MGRNRSIANSNLNESKLVHSNSINEEVGFHHKFSWRDLMDFSEDEYTHSSLEHKLEMLHELEKRREQYIPSGIK